MIASTDTVIAVPIAMAKTEAMPPRSSPFSNAKVSTISAPEQGRMPIARIAEPAPFQSKSLPPRSLGSGMCTWPQPQSGPCT